MAPRGKRWRNPSTAMPSASTAFRSRPEVRTRVDNPLRPLGTRRADVRCCAAMLKQDPLARYRAKRDFARTAEPAGRSSAKGHVAAGAEPKRRFVVQKHAATRLHFDLRIELGGVLKSWAVTRGPSLDPAEKRLAVEVEDHPIEYRSFEGVIEAGYGAGTVMLWDEGTWELAPESPDAAEALTRGNLKFVLHGQRLRGGWDLGRVCKG